MISIEESPRTSYKKENDVYYMHYKEMSSEPINYEFTSDKTAVTKEELIQILETHDYVKA